MYRIAVLTNSRAQEAFLTEQILQFCAEHCLFPQMDCYHDQESFFETARSEPLTNAVIALPGVDGLNAVEHLRALCPQTRVIWCSDLDFSLQQRTVQRAAKLRRCLRASAYRRRRPWTGTMLRSATSLTQNG